jgi:hypothetical protein
MGMGCVRVVERVCASTGNLAEAPSAFEPALDVPLGGLLWALPALLENGLLSRARDLFHLPKGFYSLIHIFLLLGFMALARIKTVEQLRFNPPGEFGKLLGLDRIPEVRTLREKIKLIADPKAVSNWMSALSHAWMTASPQSAGILYVDGHIRPYHGQQTKLPRRYVPRERLCLRGTTDYWVNDLIGRPFFVVTTPLSDGLLAILREDIVPRLLLDVPGQPDDEQLEADPHLHRFMLVFDREGYSPDFFKELLDLRIACQTYHKYPKEDWPESEFFNHTVQMPHGNLAEMLLAERGTRLSNGLWVREIRKLGKSGHQIPVLSTDWLSKAEAIAAHMFTRWSQENFFKYMIHHYGINGLVDYSLTPVNETSTVVNPAYRKLEGQIKSCAGTLGRRYAEFGQMAMREGLGPKQIEAYERKKGQVMEEIDFLKSKLDNLKKERKNTKRHITFADLPEGEQFPQLAPERKHFVDTIRMVAYRAETAMAILVKDFMARGDDDARSFLREVFNTEADIIPNNEEGTLTVRLHHLANHMSDEAAQSLAKHLTDTETIYPGTNLRLLCELVSN